MSQEYPSQPHPNSSEAQDIPPVEATFEVVDEVVDDAAVLQVESTAEIEPEPQLISPPVSPPPQPPQVKSQTLQTLQQFWRIAQPKLKAGAIATYKGTLWAWAALRTGGQIFWAWWNRVLPKIRRLLPASLQTQLPDAVLTGAIATILVLFLWLTPSLFFSKPRTQVATPLPSPPSLPSSSSPPSPKPTPEQPPIALIQEQVAEISNQYANGLIQSVQANFRANRLTVNVSDGWYELSETQQGKLANDILKRVQQLNFSKLELADSGGTLLARSPVVGSEMVVLRPTRLQKQDDGMTG